MNKGENKHTKAQIGGMPFGRNGHMMARGPAEKPKNFRGTVRKLVNYLKVFRLKILIVFVFAIVSTMFSIFGPKLLGQATNQIVNDYVSIKTYDESLIQLKKESLSLRERPVFHVDKIRDIFLILFGLYVISALLGYLQGWVMTGVSQRVTYQFRKDISDKINKLPLRYFDKHNYGEVLSRVINDVDTVSQTLNQSLSQLVTAVVMIVGILIMMLTISWVLTLVTILILPLSFGLLGWVMKRSQTQFVRQQSSLGALNGHIEEMYTGHLVVKVFNGEKTSEDKFDLINRDLYDSAWKSQFLSGLMFPLMNFVGNLGYVGVAAMGGWLAIRGRLQIGDIQAFVQYVQQFNQPITQTANVANVMQSMAAAAERVFEFLDEDEEIVEIDEPIRLEKIKGKVEFKNVIFGYKADQMVIKNLSVKIEPGQKVAIVGPTGAGKTTLVNLLMRFYELDAGSIEIDGVDIKRMLRSDVRRMFGMVLQDTWLFKGTIRDNIMYGNDRASEKELIEAAKEAHVDHFIRSLPDGYDMEINEETSNISQGEKQLLTIARAMLARSPMLILDEATSSVDTRTEVLIQKAMETLMKNKTSFVIAHRLSTIRGADLILVMNNGDVIEKGTHEELLGLNGFYTALYNSQFDID